MIIGCEQTIDKFTHVYKGPANNRFLPSFKAALEKSRRVMENIQIQHIEENMFYNFRNGECIVLPVNIVRHGEAL